MDANGPEFKEPYNYFTQHRLSLCNRKEYEMNKKMQVFQKN